MMRSNLNQEIHNEFLQSRGYSRLAILGQGAVSVVMKGYNKDEQLVAIKVVTNQTQSGRQNQYEQEEIKTNKELMDAMNKDPCQFICQIYDICREEQNTYIISEFCSKGDLFNYYSTYYQFFNETIFTQMMYQLITGIEYLHKQRIIHRDLKPENILVTEMNNSLFLKLTDFGISSHMELTQSQVGTINYMAPEILRNYQYSNAVDIWSFGCIAYEIINCQQLFTASSQIGVCKQILNFKYFQKRAFDLYELYQIIESCLNVDPLKRPTASEIREQLDTHIKRLSFKNDLPPQFEQNEEETQEEEKEDFQKQKDSSKYQPPEGYSQVSQNEDIENQPRSKKMSFKETRLSATNSFYETIQSVKPNEVDISTLQQTKVRVQEENILTLIQERSFGEEIIQEKSFSKSTVYYPIYANNFFSNEQNTNLVHFLSVLIMIIKTENPSLIKDFLKSLDIVIGNSEQKIQQVLTYAIFNSMMISESTQKRIEYFCKDVLRITLIQNDIILISKRKKDQIESFFTQYSQQCEENIQDLKIYIPSSKTRQFFGFLSHTLWNRNGVFLLISVSFLTFAVYYYYHKEDFALQNNFSALFQRFSSFSKEPTKLRIQTQ